MAAAALALFGERGYDAVSAAEIAARAGVTERTFFRHFANKREVLFAGEAVLRDALLAAVADMPRDTGALATLFGAFDAVTPLLEANRSFAEPRQAIVARTPALAERELAKLATLADALADALKTRGVADLAATLAAQTAMAAFTQATLAWLDDPAVALGDRLAGAAAALETLFGGEGAARADATR